MAEPRLTKRQRLEVLEKRVADLEQNNATLFSSFKDLLNQFDAAVVAQRVEMPPDDWDADYIRCFRSSDFDSLWSAEENNADPNPRCGKISEVRCYIHWKQGIRVWHRCSKDRSHEGDCSFMELADPTDPVYHELFRR